MADFSSDDLTRINKAITDPNQRVQFRDRSVTKRSIEELMTAQRIVEEDLVAQGARPQQIKQFRAKTSKGL